MNREEYITCRNNNSLMEPLYSYYSENFKGKSALDIHRFSQAISMWPGANQAVEKVVREYDVKYEIISIQDLKTGQIIKYL